MGLKRVKLFVLTFFFLVIGFYHIFSNNNDRVILNTMTIGVKDHDKISTINRSTQRRCYNIVSCTGAQIKVTNKTLSMIEEIQRGHKPLSGPVGLADQEVPICEHGETSKNQAEDLLCMKSPTFSPKYKNSCWVYAEKQLKCLPYFQIIGMDKSGSSDLFDRISQHRDVVPNDGFLGKETMWWSWKRYGFWLKDQPGRWETFENYTSYFNKAAKQIFANSSAQIVTGDGTPMDFWDFRGWVHIPQNQPHGAPMFLTPSLLKHVNPNVKLILILRNPTERLFSDYFFLGLGKMTALSYHRNLLKSIRILRDCVDQMSLKLCLLSKDFNKKAPVRIHFGFYSIYLHEWLKVFPREQFIILRTEDYSSNMRHYLNKIFDFLNLRKIPASNLTKIVNSSRKRVTLTKKHVTMLPESRKVAELLYRPFNVELSNLLQDDNFSWLHNN